MPSNGNLAIAHFGDGNDSRLHWHVDFKSGQRLTRTASQKSSAKTAITPSSLFIATP
jgi:hypothetical protein